MRMRTFTAEEQAAIKRVAQGGKLENVLPMFGKFAPTDSVSAAMSGGAGFVAGGPAGATAPPLTGVLSRRAAANLIMRNATAAQALMRRGPLQEANATLGGIIAAEQARPPAVQPLALPALAMLAIERQYNAPPAAVPEAVPPWPMN